MRARLWQRQVVKVSERDEGGRGRPKVQLGGTRREHAARPLRPGRPPRRAGGATRPPSPQTGGGGGTGATRRRRRGGGRPRRAARAGRLADASEEEPSEVLYECVKGDQ